MIRFNFARGKAIRINAQLYEIIKATSDRNARNNADIYEGITDSRYVRAVGRARAAFRRNADRIHSQVTRINVTLIFQ